jgi:uncharacterized OB-fold protein
MKNRIACSITDGEQYDDNLIEEDDSECECCGDLIHYDHNLCAECAADLNLPEEK